MTTASLVLYKTDRAELETVLACLAGVQKIYLVDNSPTNKLRDFERPGVEYIWGHGNVGYGAGHNIAIRKARELGAQYHVVLNSDVYFDEAVLSRLEQYMDDNYDVGLVMPLVVSPEGETQYLCKLLPTPLDLFGRRFLPWEWLRKRLARRFEMHDSGYGREMDVPFLSGCFMFFRMDSLWQTGGFSDRYWMYCEDIDLCRRVGDVARTVYWPSVTVVHAHRQESYKSNGMMWVHIRSAVAYFNHFGWWFDRERIRRNRRAVAQYK